MLNEHLIDTCKFLSTLSAETLRKHNLGCLVDKSLDEMYEILSKQSRITIIRWDSYDNLVKGGAAKDIFDLASSQFPGLFIIGEVEDAIRDEIRKYGYSFSGDYHGHGQTGIPVFTIDGYSDEYFYFTSARSWGGLMADVWGGFYMDFYCCAGDEKETCVPA